jgi:hypothetical protein
VPRRPGGGEASARLIESGIRRLVLGAGPSIRKLLHDHSIEIQGIMQAARPPSHWSLGNKAAAILSVIHDAINEITNPRWRSATLAAFGIPHDRYRGIDSVTGRWRELAKREGARGAQISSSVERYRGYWMTAAHHLAKEIEFRFRLLDSSVEGWKIFRLSGPQAPPVVAPILFNRSDIIYTFDGYRGVQSYHYHWITVYGDVDCYEPVARYASQPDAAVEIVPIANCELDGPLRDLPLGGRIGTLRFARTLQAGNKCFFAYLTKYNSDLPCRPTILQEVRTLGISSLAIRAQFDVRAIPAKCWYFEDDGSRIPAHDDAPELLKVESNGYVEYTFFTCERGRDYGIRWAWPQNV